MKIEEEPEALLQSVKNIKIVKESQKSFVMSYQLKIATLLFLVFFCTTGTAQTNLAESDSLFKEGRRLFALSVEDKDQINPALDLFKKIINEKGNFLHNRALVYIGALHIINAKHIFFPLDKLKWAKEGLSIMDNALALAPEDIEVLFVHGTICHNLPGLFKREDDAKRNFQKIVELLPDNVHRYGEYFIADVLDYLDKEVNLNKDERKIISKINSNLSIAAGEIE